MILSRTLHVKQVRSSMMAVNFQIVPFRKESLALQPDWDSGLSLLPTEEVFDAEDGFNCSCDVTQKGL